MFISLAQPTLLLANAFDPLFARMLGNWDGEGMRTQESSGHQVSILAHTETTLEGSKLISKNRITETPVDAAGVPQGPSRSYKREYWIRALTGSRYSFGIGVGTDEQVFSEGLFKQDTLEVEQKIGNVSPYIVQSRTQFEGTFSDYTEVVSQNGKPLSQTRVRYWRSTSMMSF